MYSNTWCNFPEFLDRRESETFRPKPFPPLVVSPPRRFLPGRSPPSRFGPPPLSRFVPLVAHFSL